jgi:DNA polymerase III sliding clamp (beta) subunit (PCNA family)
MKFSILADVLRPQLNRCAKVATFDTANSKSGGLKPIYGYVQLSVDNMLLTMRAQDPTLHFEARAIVSAIDSPGSALVECDRLVSILKTRVDGYPITMWVEGEFLHLKQGEFQAKLPLLKNEEIPSLNLEQQYDFKFDFEPKILEYTKRCGSVVEDEKSDSPFKGLLFDLSEQGVLRLAGLSSSLCHIARFTLPNHTEKDLMRVAVPFRALPLIESLSGNLPMTLGINKLDGRVCISSSECSMSIRCIEDTYPKTYVQFLGFHRQAEHVYPLAKLDADGNIVAEQTRNWIRFNRNDFLNALTSASCLLGKEDNAVELSIKQKLPDGRFIVQLTGLNRFTKATAVEKILADSDLPGLLTIGLHFGKLKEALRLMTEDTFTMLVIDKNTPVVLVEDKQQVMASVNVPLRLS